MKNIINSPKVQKPLPLVVNNVVNYQEITLQLQTRNLNYNATLLNNDQVKINVNDVKEYPVFTKAMNDSKQQ